MTMPIPDGSVVITPAQMYQEIRETRNAVDRLTNTVDPALSDLRSDARELKTTVGEHSAFMVAVASRVTVLETKIKVAWTLLGLALTGLGVVAGFVGAFQSGH